MTITNIPSDEMKSIVVPSSSKLNEDIVKNLSDLFCTASPAQYRDALMTIYHAYIIHHHDALPIRFDEFSKQIADLIQFLNNCDAG